MTTSHKNWTAIILAAGEGTRMRSSLPKVLHRLAGRPMIRFVVDAAHDAGIEHIVAVVGPDGDDVRLAAGDGVEFAVQAERLGTGHALVQANDAIGACDQVLVLNGDVPLITPSTLLSLMRAHEANDADVSFLTAHVEEAGEYGCVQRDAEGSVTAIVEAPERDGAVEGPAEINSGQYCFNAEWLLDHLGSLPTAANGEQYITSLIDLAVEEGATINATAAEESSEVRGINDRVQLAEAEAALRRTINRQHMLAGVSFVDPDRTYIDVGVSIGRDTVIEPNTHLNGETSVGEQCRIGPDTTIRDSTLGDNCTIVASTLEEATLEDDVDVGPYSHMRAGTYLCAGVHIGNYAEVKSARLGRGVKMGHFSYIGDAEVGEGTNIGAGTITCNFDGERKHRTRIGRDAFIGSDTMLIAPVTVGDGARTAAGSVVNRDVPDGALAAGAPARIRRQGDDR